MKRLTPFQRWFYRYEPIVYGGAFAVAVSVGLLIVIAARGAS